MKIAFKIIFVGLIATLTSIHLDAQNKETKDSEKKEVKEDSREEVKKDIVTAEFNVSGVCKMCTKRIENAALIKGVKFVEWTKETQILKVIYKTETVTEEDIHKAVAEVGHDTEKVKATNESYQKLPKCCRYRDGVKVH